MSPLVQYIPNRRVRVSINQYRSLDNVGQCKDVQLWCFLDVKLSLFPSGKSLVKGMTVICNGVTRFLRNTLIVHTSKIKFPKVLKC